MVKSITIVGGGTAGWMTAAYLTRTLEQGVNITVVDSPTINTIGVGEATFSTIKLFFDWLGLEEWEWMPNCNAAYKVAIKFVDWTAQRGHFYHPFKKPETIDGFSIYEWWLKLKRGEEAVDYCCSIVPAICEAKRSPRFLDGRVFDDLTQAHFGADRRPMKGLLENHSVQYPYAYHFDAGLLAAYLKAYAIQRGARHIPGEVVDVNLTEDGRIESVQTIEHGAVGGDLFVDCTGFRGLLINKALGEPFLSFAEVLPCDRAIATQIPVDIAKVGMSPYTTATALSSGWAWDIPLYGRIGTGYVYCSSFLSEDEAEVEFRRHLGPRAHDCSVSRIKMRIGRSRNSWVKNCVAIGLASGFVEPLESTGIFFIQHGIEELANHLPHGVQDEELVKSYNRTVGQCIDGVMNFLVLHYQASDRSDSKFWQTIRQDTVLPEALLERWALWKKRVPSPKSVNPEYHGFEAHSYAIMLLGLNSPPEANLAILDRMNDRNALALFDAIQSRSKELVATLPSQYEYLNHTRARGVAGPSYQIA